jgi:hypothetical protein
LAVAACGSPVGQSGGHASLPLEVYSGGPLLTAPLVVTVTFEGDPMAAELEAFGQTVASSAWWDAVRSGYCASGGATCVGDGPQGITVQVPTPAATQYTDSDQNGASTLQEWLKSAITNGVLPMPDSNSTSDTLYVLYFPSTTTISLDGADSCVEGGFGGYHNSMMFGSQQVPYVAAIECEPIASPFPNIATLTALQNTTMTASHEIVEASTDPVPPTAFAIDDTDPNNWGWIDVTGGGEAADMCVDFLGLDQDETSDAVFTVQRIWSNSQATSGLDPCNPLPAAGDVYFNAAPRQAFFIVAVGESVTFEVDAFASAPMGDWTLTAQDWSDSAAPVLSFAIGGGVGSDGGPLIQVHDGSAVQVTVTLLQDPGSLDTGEADGSLISFSGNAEGPLAGHFWPIAVMSPADAVDAHIPLGTGARRPMSHMHRERPVHSRHVSPARSWLGRRGLPF